MGKLKRRQKLHLVNPVLCGFLVSMTVFCIANRQLNSLLADAGAKQQANRCFLKGDFIGQIGELEKALALNATDTDALFSYASALEHVGRLDEAVSAYGRVIALNPQSAPAKNQRAKLLYRMGRIDQCIADCKAALLIEPEDPDTFALMCQVHRAQKQYQAAIDDISKAIVLSPAPIDYLITRAKLYRLVGKYEMSIADCTRIRKMDWAADEALEERAQAYELLGKHNLAAADRSELRLLKDKPPSQNAISLAHGVPDGLTSEEYYRLARQYGGTYPKEALECIERVQRLAPNSLLAHKSQCLRDTKIPAKLPPARAIILNRLAFYSISDHNECRRLAQECVKSFPDFEYGYITLGSLEKDCGHNDKAIELFKAALVINPHNTEALARLGDVLRWHDVPTAKTVLRSAVKYDPDDTVSAYLLELYASE